MRYAPCSSSGRRVCPELDSGRFANRLNCIPRKGESDALRSVLVIRAQSMPRYPIQGGSRTAPTSQSGSAGPSTEPALSLSKCSRHVCRLRPGKTRTHARKSPSTGRGGSRTASTASHARENPMPYAPCSSSGLRVCPEPDSGRFANRPYCIPRRGKADAQRSVFVIRAQGLARTRFSVSRRCWAAVQRACARRAQRIVRCSPIVALLRGTSAS